jgi:uncharacterized protein
MKCPTCQGSLHRQRAGGILLNICDRGCGGIWFAKSELERMDPRASISLHPAAWCNPNAKVLLAEARACPNCPHQMLHRKLFSDFICLEIDQCPSCEGFWLDRGEFARIYRASGGAAVPLWAVTMGDMGTFSDRRNRA